MDEHPLLSRPLLYFVAVAEEGSFTAAARALAISQPSLSNAVRKLEEEVGARLFHRGARGVLPTRAGEILLERTRQARRTLAAARDEIGALDTDPRGHFVLGIHESLGTYFLPGFMGRFLSRYPEIALSLHNGNSRDVELAVMAREIDVGVVVNPEGHPDAVLRPLFSDSVSFMVAAELMESAETRQKLLEKSPLLHLPRLSQSQFLLGALPGLGIQTPRRIACSSMELVKSLVLDAVGVGILPYRVATHGVVSGKLIPLGGGLPRYDDTISLVWRYDLPMTAGARILLDALLAHGQAMPDLPEVLRKSE